MPLTFLFNFKYLIFALNSTNDYTILKIKILNPCWLYMRGSMYFYDYLQHYTWRSDTTSDTMFSPLHVLCIHFLWTYPNYKRHISREPHEIRHFCFTNGETNAARLITEWGMKTDWNSYCSLPTFSYTSPVLL